MSIITAIVNYTGGCVDTYTDFKSKYEDSTAKTVIVTTPITLTADVTGNANCDLVFEGSGKISGAFTLTVNGHVSAPENHQWIGDDLTVDLTGCKNSVVYPGWAFTNTTPGTTDVSVGLQKILDSKKTVQLPSEEMYTGTTTPYSYSYQTVQGCGIGKSIIANNATIGFAAGDADGVFDVTTKDPTVYTFLNDFTVRANAAGSIGVQAAGFSNSGLKNIEVEKNADEGAGSRTGVGIHIGKADKAGSGCFYNDISGLKAKWFGIGFVYGPGSHSNGDIRNVDFHYNDTGILEDNGSTFGYSVITQYPVMFNLNGGSVEQSDGTAIDLNSTLTTYREFSNLYIEGQVDGIVQESGQTFLNGVRFASSSNQHFTLNGGTLSYVASNPNAGYISRAINLNHAVGIGAFYDSTDTYKGISSPKHVSGVAILNGDNTHTYASTTITFATLDPNLTSSGLVIAGIWGNCIGSALGGVSNALYNVGFSDITLFGSDTDIQINVVRVDGTPITTTDQIQVQWHMLVYIP